MAKLNWERANERDRLRRQGYESAREWSRELHEQRAPKRKPKAKARLKYDLPRCPRCRAKMIYRRRKSDGRGFMGCASFPECTYACSMETWQLALRRYKEARQTANRG